MELSGFLSHNLINANEILLSSFPLPVSRSNVDLAFLNFYAYINKRRRQMYKGGYEVCLERRDFRSTSLDLCMFL